VMMFGHRQLVAEKAQALVMQGDAHHHGNCSDQDGEPVWPRYTKRMK